MLVANVSQLVAVYPRKFFCALRKSRGNGGKVEVEFPAHRSPLALPPRTYPP